MKDLRQPTTRLQHLEQDVELELIPLESRETWSLILIGLALCLGGPGVGGVLFYLSAAEPGDQIGWVGAALMLLSLIIITLTLAFLEPHPAAKHATQRTRHHIRKFSSNRTPSSMTEREFESIESSLDHYDQENIARPFGNSER